MFGLFFQKVYLIKSKIWPFLKQSLAFFSYKLLATLVRVHIQYSIHTAPPASAAAVAAANWLPAYTALYSTQAKLRFRWLEGMKETSCLP